MLPVKARDIFRFFVSQNTVENRLWKRFGLSLTKAGLVTQPHSYSYMATQSGIIRETTTRVPIQKERKIYTSLRGTSHPRVPIPLELEKNGCLVVLLKNTGG